MKILGIDPGIATIGFGLIQSEHGRHGLLQYGTITTPAGQSLSKRLLQISNDMDQLLDAFHPDEIAIEELFFKTNITTGISVAHGRGVILLSVEKHGIPVYEYSPMQVKQAVTGYGKASKAQVMRMTQQLLKLQEIPRPDDAADALAIAICHGRSTASLLSRQHSGDPNVYSTK